MITVLRMLAIQASWLVLGYREIWCLLLGGENSQRVLEVRRLASYRLAMAIFDQIRMYTA